MAVRPSRARVSPREGRPQEPGDADTIAVIDRYPAPRPGKPRGPIASPPRAAWAVLVLALLITGLAHMVVTAALREARRDRFSFRWNEAQAAIEGRLTAYEQALHGALGFFRASQDVTREEWRIFVDGLRLAERFPGIQGLGYAQWVPPGREGALVRSERDTGVPDFRIWPEGGNAASGAWGGGRAVIRLIEPMDARNRRALGFDMWSQAERRAAMEQARDGGHTAFTGSVQLVQETDRDVQQGFLAYLAHYTGPAPDPTTREDRRARLLGFVYAPFRVRDFMAPVAAAHLTTLRLRIHVGADHDRSLFYDSHPDRAMPPDGDGLAAQSRIDRSGQVWTLRWTTLPSFDRDMDDWAPPVILVLGTLFGALGFSAVGNATGRRVAEDRNAQLGRIIEEAASEVYVLDARDLRVVLANRGARRNLGCHDHALPPVTLLDIQGDLDRTRFDALTRPLRRGVQAVSYDTRHRRLDGSLYDVSATIQLHPTSDPPVYHALVVDMTERRKAEAAVTAALKETRALLEEKETLLREIHHRVKNNLQVIWSLIRLEAADIQDPGIRARLETVARRIGVLGEIHQQLYSSSNFARIDFAEHLRRLGDNLRALHAHQNVAIVIEADPLLCDIETAIPLGLIANELISNSLEHGFADGRKGRVAATLRTDGGRVVLTVADDGIGRSGAARTGLGLRLVRALTRQLGGDMVEADGDGARTTITLSGIALSGNAAESDGGARRDGT